MCRQMIVGIDPGLTGAVAYLDDTGAFYKVEDMAVVRAGSGRKVKNEVNAAKLALDIGQLEIPSVVVVERTHSMPKMAAQTVFSMGDSLGVIRGVIAAAGIPSVFVDPKDWKRHFGLGKDKEKSRAVALQLFPRAPLSLVKHHNRAESILIAKWYMDTRVNKQ